jgi:hypothetical protein
MPRRERGDWKAPPGDKLAAAFIERQEVIDCHDLIDAVDDAVALGEDEAMMPVAFLARVIPDLDPLDYPHLRELWNQLCDEQGAPERKLAPLQKRQPPPKAVEQPFTVGKPIHYKQPTDDAEEGGSF